MECCNSGTQGERAEGFRSWQLEVKDWTLATNKLSMRTKGWRFGTLNNEPLDSSGGLPKTEKHATRGLTFVVGGCDICDLCKVRKYESRYWAYMIRGGGQLKKKMTGT